MDLRLRALLSGINMLTSLAGSMDAGLDEDGSARRLDFLRAHLRTVIKPAGFKSSSSRRRWGAAEVSIGKLCSEIVRQAPGGRAQCLWIPRRPPTTFARTTIKRKQAQHRR